jgi:hypothetical protein
MRLLVLALAALGLMGCNRAQLDTGIDPETGEQTAGFRTKDGKFVPAMDPYDQSKPKPDSFDPSKDPDWKVVK